jgi:hypothetical protein
VGGPPYGATVPGVRALVLDVAAEGLRPNQRAPRVSDDQLREWIDSAGSTVALRLARLGLLPATSSDGSWQPGLPTQADVELEARQLVELYVAAKLADVTHPERANNGKGFGDVLRARYEADLTGLVAVVETGVERMGSDGGADAIFPPASMIGRDRTTPFGLSYGLTQWGYPAGRGF